MSVLTRNQAAFLLNSALLAAAIFFTPPPSGLSVHGWQTLLLVLYAIALWATECIASPLTALLVMVLFSVLGILSFPKAVAGFGDPVIWLLLGVYIISAAMRESGFDRRLALNLLNLAQGRTSMVILMLNAATSLFVFLLPTSSGRASLVTPLCLGIIQAMNLRQGSNVAKAMLISVSYVSLIGAMGLMTGAISMVYSVSLFETVIGYKWTYFGWMLVMLPGSLICSLLLWPLILRIFPPELSHLPGGVQYIQGELQSLGNLSGKEIRVIAIISTTIACWLFEDKLGISVAQSCLMAGIALMLPGIGVVTWKKASDSIEWGAIFLLGASIAMVEALQATKAIEWVTYALFASLPGLGHVSTSIILMLLLIVIRLGFPNLLAMAATALPVVFSFAATTGMNPVWLGMLCVTTSVIGLFLPTQSITHLITYSTGYYSTGDMFKAGVYSTALVTAVILLLAHFYWPLVGISPFPG